MSLKSSPQLRRELGVVGATVMGLGSIIGTGVFVSIGIAAGIAGNAVILAVIIGALGWYYQSWWGLIALLPLLTAFSRVCPAWTIFGISTIEKKKN